jgi:hypothetical protein
VIGYGMLSLSSIVCLHAVAFGYVDGYTHAVSSPAFEESHFVHAGFPATRMRENMHISVHPTDEPGASLEMMVDNCD